MSRTKIHLGFFSLLALAFYFCGVTFADTPAQRWRNWLEWEASPEGRGFPRFAWAFFGYPKSGLSLADFQTYANAGFTSVQVRLDQNFIDAARENKLGLILGTWENAINNAAAFDKIADYARNDNGVHFVLLKDEVNLKEARLVGDLNRRIVEQTPSTILPIQSVLPGHASSPRDSSRFDPALFCNEKRSYCDYVESVMLDSNASAILPTLYPLFEGNVIRSNYYENLSELRDLTRKHSIGLFGFVLVTPHFDAWAKRRYADPTPATIYWQAYTSIAFNAKGLAFYGFKTKPSEFNQPPLFYGDGLLGGEGQYPSPTSAYSAVKSLNCEIQGLGGVFLKGDFYEALLTSKGRVGKSWPFSYSDKSSHGFLVSEMRVKGQNAPYFLVINNNLDAGGKEDMLSLAINASSSLKRLSASKDCNLQTSKVDVDSRGRVDIAVLPGHAVLLQVDKR